SAGHAGYGRRKADSALATAQRQSGGAGGIRHGRREAGMSAAREAAAAQWRLADPHAIAALVTGRHGDPFSVLGPHESRAGIVLRALRPEAETAEAVEPETGKVLAKLLRRHARGFFEGLIAGKKTVPRYRLRFTRQEDVWEEEDPYRFPSTFGEL